MKIKPIIVVKARSALRAKLVEGKAHVLKKAHWLCHGIYLGAVTIEAHGWYGKAAGALLIVVVIGALLGEADHD